MRYVVEYVRRDGCFLKKKVWDGVTGTIFNMPMSPSCPPSPTISDNQRRISTLYGDFYRDKAPQHRNPDYFPLDIRRIDRIDPETGKKHPVTHLLEGTEDLVRWPWNNPEGSFAQLDPSDPWFVTEEQHEKQLVPPRKYPPGKSPCPGGDTLLPTDDTIWKEEIENDANFRSQYFVTNLHGGTLIINGLEIKLGQIAGPLPEFAIIETPGNQISFWFGPQGRDWRGVPDGAPLCTSQWKTLRRSPGWENVGLTAGQVWDLRIRDRLRREYMGEEADDDAQWDEWKTAVVKQKPIPENISPLDMVIWDGRPGPSPAHAKQTPEAAQPEFSTELEELQWLVTKAYPLKDVTPTLERENIILPPPSALWPGPNTPERPDIVHQQSAQRIWDKRREEILQQQREMNAMLAQQRAARALERKQKVDAENRKRKAAGSWGPAAKKARRDDDAQLQGNSQAEYEERQDNLRGYWEREREIWENDSSELEKIAEDAAIAAKTREALKDQDPRLSLLSNRQREKEEQKIKDRVKYQHAAERKKEQELRKTRILEANKERAEKGLQLLPELPPPSSKEEIRQVAEKARKIEQKNDEEHRKQVELEKKRQESEKGRKEAEKKQQEAAAALKKTSEPAEVDATALDERVADALAAENEQKRLQFIADREAARKAEREQREKEAAAEAARAERARRAYLSQDKYGFLPAVGFKLDAFGKPEFGQGFELPPRKPSFKILSPDDLERMTEEQWIEYAKLLSVQREQPGNAATGEKPVDLSSMSYDQQIARATKQTLGINRFKNLEEENTRKVFIENVKRLLTEQSARIRLELKAKSEGVSAEQYAINHNFKSAADYISADINPFGLDNLPQVKDNDLPANVLQMSRYWIQHYAQTGLQIRANREGKSMDALAQEKGYSSLEEYLRALSDSISIDDIPAIPKNQTPQDREKWEALCQRILDAGEWEARVRYLPGPRTLRPLADKRHKRFIVL